MRIRAVIFDLDGTLLYTLDDLKDSVNYALKQCNLKERTLDEIRTFVGNGIYKLIERAVGANKEQLEKCFEVFKYHYNKNCNNTTKPYKNVIETLKKLKEKDIKLAILSNKADFAVKNLTNIYFKNLIDISMGENKKYAKKPDSTACLYILEKFNVKKEEAIFVGDSEVDLQTAKNAGIRCLSASWGYKEKEFLAKSGANIIINSIEEILNFV